MMLQSFHHRTRNVHSLKKKNPFIVLKINIKCIKIIKCALLHLIRGFFKAFISTYFAACKSRGTSSDKLTVEVECRRRIGSIFFKRDLGYAIVIKHLSWFSNAQLFLTLFL